MVVMLFTVRAGENFEIPIEYLTACGITVLYFYTVATFMMVPVIIDLQMTVNFICSK